MLFHILAFLCLAKAQRDENLSTDDDKTDLDQRRKPGWSPTIDDDKIPVIFDNEHTDGSWTSLNSTSDDSCTYVEQDDGSILINTMHRSFAFDYCHEFWECDNPDHIMFFKWNKVDLAYGTWARFAWGTEDNDQEVKSSLDREHSRLTETQKNYRNTRSNKIVWDYEVGMFGYGWGVEAQIKCIAPSNINECTLGTHDCSSEAKCIKESGMSEYICQCPPNGIKWGDQRLFTTAAGTISDPCFYSHPDKPSLEVFPIEWDGDTFGVAIQETDGFGTWQDAFLGCNKLGMTLPLPSNDAENTALINVLRTKVRRSKIFLGAHTTIDEPKWTNIYTNEEIRYNQWGVDQPKNIGYADKVALLTTESGEWYDQDLLAYRYYARWTAMCIKVDYEEWDPEDVNLGSFLCESNLNRCHASSTCIPCRASDNCIDYQGSEYARMAYYRCECEDQIVDGIELIANDTYSGFYCEYNSPSLLAPVQIFTYDGKPTLYHYNQNYDYEFDVDYYNDDPYDHNFNEAVEYCHAIGMQLPAPNTQQQYEDLKKIPRNSVDDSIWLGYTPSPSLDAWLNVYNGEKLAINNIDPPTKDNYRLEMNQFGSFEWNIVWGKGRNYYLSTLCIQAWVYTEHNFRWIFKDSSLKYISYTVYDIVGHKNCLFRRPALVNSDLFINSSNNISRANRQNRL